jgi:uncharacterized protein YeaO (DUF488 family)
MIKLKRVYDDWEKDDGYRILVDRLWPRGVSKEKAHVDLWPKEIAPSTELRKWFGHDVQKWEEFEKKYKKELETKKELVDQVKQLEQEHSVITLLYAARDTEHNDAVVLLSILEQNK